MGVMMVEMKTYYQDDYATIYHADCREVLPTLGKVDLVLTDPPYEISTSGGGIGGKRKYLSDIKGFTDGGFDMELLDRFPAWICFCSIAQLPRLIEKAQRQRWMLVTWNKPNPTPLVNGNYLPDTEYIVHCFPSKGLHGQYEHRRRYINYPAQQHNLHPNEKPLPVIMKLIHVGIGDEGIILDPFMGSGTTLRAAKDLRRKCIGIEREERYCEIGAKRLQQEVLAL